MPRQVTARRAGHVARAAGRCQHCGQHQGALRAERVHGRREVVAGAGALDAAGLVGEFGRSDRPPSRYGFVHGRLFTLGDGRSMAAFKQDRAYVLAVDRLGHLGPARVADQAGALGGDGGRTRGAAQPLPERAPRPAGRSGRPGGDACAANRARDLDAQLDGHARARRLGQRDAPAVH